MIEIGRRLIDGVWRTGPADESAGGGSQPAVKAALTLDGQDNATGDVVYTAISAGGPGNGIEVIQDTVDIDQSLSVVVSGSQITVHLATDHDGLVTSTANAVVAAVNADSEANLLVVASPGSTGAGLAGQTDGRLSGGIAADATTALFNGCRYPIQDDGSNLQLTGSDSVFRVKLGGGPSGEPHYDTGGYGTRLATGYLSDGGYLFAPQDGYYRMTGNITADFTGSDATSVQAIIASPDRDNEWDSGDHLVLAPPTPTGVDSGSVTVTHWLAAGDRIAFGAHAVDGSTGPYAHGAFEVSYLGSGDNPVS